jgi:hypothetical protein
MLVILQTKEKRELQTKQKRELQTNPKNVTNKPKERYKQT